MYFYSERQNSRNSPTICRSDTDHNVVIYILYHPQNLHHLRSIVIGIYIMVPFAGSNALMRASVAPVVAIETDDAAATSDHGDPQMLSRLHEIIDQRQLSALFQPIIDMHSGDILGYEGLIRGPSNSPLHSPHKLFKVARLHNLSVEVEHLCRHIVMAQFAKADLPGSLFQNVSPGALVQREARLGETLRYLQEIGINPR